MQQPQVSHYLRTKKVRTSNDCKDMLMLLFFLFHIFLKVVLIKMYLIEKMINRLIVRINIECISQNLTCSTINPEELLLRKQLRKSPMKKLPYSANPTRSHVSFTLFI